MVLDKKFRPEYGLALLWLCMQAALFLIYGIHTDLEAAKYTNAAMYLSVHGTLPAPKYIFYAVLILIIYFFKAIGLGYGGVALLQILLNGIATYYLYQLCYGATRNRQSARIATLLFIIFFPIQTWNVYLFTESLFISFTLLFTYLLFRFPPNNFKNFSLHILALAILCLTRPFGFLYIIPFMLYAILISPKRFRLFLLGTSLIAVVAFFMLINTAFKGGEDMDALKPFREGHIICFIPDPDPPHLQLVQTGNPLYDIGYYIVHNPTHFLTLMYKRILSFFNLSRHYYSKAHNFLLLLFIIPVYGFGLFAFFKCRPWLQHPVFRFMVILIIFYTIAVTFQCDDYHSRFTMPLFAYFFLFAACGFSCLIKKKIEPDSSHP